MQDQAGAADESEEDKPRRDDVPDTLVKEQHQVFPHHERIELALAVLARSEGVRYFAEAQRPRAGGEKIHENLVPVA